jgi:hypothetical protein
VFEVSQKNLKSVEQESPNLLFRIRLLWDTLVDSNTEAMRRTGIEVRLECDVVLHKNTLRLPFSRRVERSIKCYKNQYTRYSVNRS